jgi:hypothetical protein
MQGINLQSARRAFSNPLVQKVILAIVVAIIIYIAYRKIFRAKFNPAKLPTGGNELPNSWISQKKYIGYANRLWTQLDGVSLGVFTTNELCGEILALTNDQIVAIYNYYNETFGRADNETLTSKLENEWTKLTNTSNLVVRLKTLKLP